ncbi:hypothetical protein ACGFY9_01290 [Streptomyces sp. NPDC048504]|uniref:ABC transporter permease subunit n=1 Tax=Streptomyces sp. NPDC048504 TaxID=3365559 RepID=UPI0037212F85
MHRRIRSRLQEGRPRISPASPSGGPGSHPRSGPGNAATFLARHGPPRSARPAPAPGGRVNNAVGVPNALVSFLACLIIVDFVLRRTAYGRKVFAVGGGTEAARRAGISVPMIRITVFAIAGGFAAVGGIFFAGRTAGAALSAGGGSSLMPAIAAVVIGGRGSVWSALLGMLVIGSVSRRSQKAVGRAWRAPTP